MPMKWQLTYNLQKHYIIRLKAEAMMNHLKQLFQKYKPEIRVGIAVFVGLFAFKIVKDLLNRFWP